MTLNPEIPDHFLDASLDKISFAHIFFVGVYPKKAIVIYFHRRR